MGRDLRETACRTEDGRDPHSKNSLLFRAFRVIGWRIVATLARPVTPEVAGSRPVAPAEVLQINICI
jgi:hypothetical protein